MFSVDPSLIFDSLDRYSHDSEVLVVGDLMLDRYVYGDIQRISPEAPVPVVRFARQTENAGGATNVALNLAGLGFSVCLAGIIGHDADGNRLLGLLEQAGINTERILPLRERPTTVKTRIASGRQQVLRIDVEDSSPLPADHHQHFLGRIGTQPWTRLRAAILSDYAKGVVVPEICRAVIEESRRRNIPVLVDPKGHDWRKYAGATAILPNRAELAAVTGLPAHDLDGLLSAAEVLRQSLGVDLIAVTLGELGIALLDGSSVQRLPAQTHEVFDVSGAGDTVIATTAAALAAGIPREDALRLANIAAGIVIRHAGTVPIQRSQLRQAAVKTPSPRPEDKICDLPQAVSRCDQWRSVADRIVFTNGCFDLIHAGHATHLDTARRLGDRLIIGLNSDQSVRTLKGPTRPIQHQNERALLLASLAAVDTVVLFDEPTPLNLVLMLRPNIMVKGGDYTEDQIAGAHEVRSWGGEVVILPLIAQHSTSRLVQKIRDA